MFINIKSLSTKYYICSDFYFLCMKKKLFFCLFFLYTLAFAQLDREHWFAPMMDRVSSAFTNHYESIYMSTNEITPFKVEIFNNNIVIATVTLSKNNPVKYSIPQRNTIITTSPGDLFIPVSMGFYLKGEKPFFASLRFSINNHGEIQTSKGTAGKGTEFRAVMAPISVNNSILNFMNSIMATEDNTKVTITDFQPTVKFADNIARTQIVFTLNRGQSYIIEGQGNSPQNHTGYIGAKIVADKPILIANGNFNGQYAGNFGNASDILMDQGVPTDKLGQEFVLMKGNGANSFNSGSTTMEKAIIVAVENNTQIYLNGSSSPIATINAGQFFETPPNSYINQGSEHFNMLINTSKKVYVYQLLAGVESTSSSSNLNGEATGGFNYIPPLNCYLPQKIDEIGNIEENEHNLGAGSILTVPTKLNIITERGATVDVKRNGTSMVLNASNGPFDVTGNASWVTYSIPNITGNIAILSSKAVTAGISAGNGAVGYGGYFAGFSSIPLILKTQGECIQNSPPVKLEVTEGFESYLWLMKVGGTFVPAPTSATYPSNTLFEYYPQQAGIYKVELQQGTCPKVQSLEYPFYNCTDYTNYDFNTCKSETIPIRFALTTQTLDPATIVELKAPDQGVTDYTSIPGSVIYTANPTALGTDTFKFSFDGNGSPPDREIAQITIHLKKIEKYDAILTECSATTTAQFNLPLANITPDATVSKTYYRKPNFTDEILPADINNYTSAPDFVYVELKNSFGCEETAIIELKVKNFLVLNQNSYNIPQCDNDLNNTENINLDLYKDFFTNETGVSVKYFDDIIKAQNNIPGEEIPASQDISADKTFYYRFTKFGFCDVIGTFTVDFKQPKKSEILRDKEVCPDPGAKATLDVEAYFAGNVVWSTGETSTSIKVGIGEHWADLTFDGCVYRQLVSVTALDIKITNIEIKGSTVTVSVTGGTPPYQYAMDNLNYQPSNVFTNVRGGDHTIYAISSENCDPAIAEINVIEAYNVITPNGDGINDVLNYSDLLKKEEPFLQIFDRLGKTVFTGDNNNKYSWDGKSSGKTVSTGSYWYIMKWREPGSTAFSEFSGWILVKNRD